MAPREQRNKKTGKHLQSDLLFSLGAVTHQRPVPRDHRETHPGVEKTKVSMVLSTDCRELLSTVWISTHLMLQPLSLLGPWPRPPTMPLPKSSVKGAGLRIDCTRVVPCHRANIPVPVANLVFLLRGKGPC